jgi:hypothetical protein
MKEKFWLQIFEGDSFLGMIATSERIHGQLWKECPDHLEW